MRSRVCLLLSLVLLFAVPAAAAHADDGLGTIRFEQQGPAGEPITGGCYRAENTEDYRERCDSGDGATDGVVVLDGLQPGTFAVSEYRAPAGYHAAADLSVAVGADETVTRTRRHEPTPRLHIVTSGSVGSCWWVRIPGDDEGFFDACDADDGAADGTTTFLDLVAADYVLQHVKAPAGLDRIDDVPFSMPGNDKTLTFTLEPAVAPTASGAPSISGGHAAGDELTGDPGTWVGSQPIDLNDAWERCNLDGSDCVATGDYDTHYTATAEDAGQALRYRITATNDGGRGSAHSALHAISTLDAPEFTTPPSITGSVTLGQRLTADPGVWTNTPTFTYQWQRCEVTCADIPGATAATYATTKSDADRRIRVVVTATNAAGHATIASEQTEPIDDDPFALERPSTSGTPQAGETMTAYPGHWSTHYGNLQFGYRWLRCAADGTDCEAVGYGDTYTIQFTDEGFSVLVEVTATDAGGLGRARSNPRAVTTLRPINVAPPTFTGHERLGEQLIGQFGRWTSPDGSRIHSDFSWQRCAADGTQCVTIPGQEPGDLYRNRHTIMLDDVGHRLRLQVGATNDHGARYAYSAFTDVITLRPPVATAPPTFTGTARVGQTLFGRNGTWAYDGTGRIHISFSWQRCEADGSRCVTIPGQGDGDLYANRHTVTLDDVGHRLRLQVAAESAEGDTYAYTELTDVITLHPPVATAPPTFSGRVRLGLELIGRNGSWAYDGAGRIHISFSWQRCAADGTQCVAIPGDGLYGNRHTITEDDLGHRLRLQVSAETVEGDTYAYTELTELVTLHPPLATAPPTFTGTARLSKTLFGRNGSWAYDGVGPVHITFTWQRCEADGSRCVTITGQDDGGLYGNRHTITEDDLGHRLRLQVSADTPDGTTYAYAPLTDVVMP